MAATRRLQKVTSYFISNSIKERICATIQWDCGYIWFDFQELEDIKKMGLKSFRDILVDEANILTWQGLILPVSPGWSMKYLSISIRVASALACDPVHLGSIRLAFKFYIEEVFCERNKD